MKFSVGFQLQEIDNEPFSKIVETYIEDISEVFFSYPNTPSGRGDIALRQGANACELIEKELIKIKQMGIKLDLLFNANCYGADSLSKKLANSVCSTINHLESVGAGVDIITTTSPAIAHTIKKYFPRIEVRASVNMKIGTVKGMEYLKKLFDSFHVQRDYNRDLNHLKMLKSWADENNKKLIMLANSGCFSNCSGQIFHDNNVAHESEICKTENISNFNPYVCWSCLKDPENWEMLLQNTWIRPEDLHNYESIFETVKLATRIHCRPQLVIDAYCKRSFSGNVLDLFEPTFSGALAPYIIDNSAFPENWFEKSTSCDKLCHKCSYCKDVFKKVLVNTEIF